MDGADEAVVDVVERLPYISVLGFDPGQRLQLARGPLGNLAGPVGELLVGGFLSQVLPASMFAELEGPFRAAVDGQLCRFDFSSPAIGRLMCVRVGSILDRDGAIVGAPTVHEDLTEERARVTQLEHLHRLSNAGGRWYHVRFGWSFDEHILDLVVADSGDQMMTALNSLVVPGRCAAVLNALQGVLTPAGRTTRQCRMPHEWTGQLRNVACGCDAVVDLDGKNLRAVPTHHDITDAVTAEAQTQDTRIQAADARTQLLRRVSDTLVAEGGSIEQIMQRITDLAAAAAGDGATLRVLSPDGHRVDHDVISHPDKPTREQVGQFLAAHTAPFDPAWGLHGVVNATGELLSSIGNPSWRADLRRRVDPQAIRPDVSHFVYAPVRHARAILGYLHVFRSDPGAPYQAGDDDLVQVLADRVGAAIAEDRVSRVVENQLIANRRIEQRLAVLTQEQRDLLDQLGDVEERERTVLAEAIHDDPLQLLVAAGMRLEQLSAEMPAQQGTLAEITGLLHVAGERLRTLIVALSPATLSDGLATALQHLADGIFIGTATTVRVTGPDRLDLGGTVTSTAYRILREGLVNARKHAHADNVTITVTDHADTVSIRLIDDGIGTSNLDAGPGHIGLATMRGRAANEGGQLRIDSTPGVGTIIELSLRKARDTELGNP